MLVKPISRVGSSSSSYTGRMNNMVTTFCDHIDNFIRPNRMNAYSNWKGGANYDSSVTASPPPLYSILHNCGFTLDIVLDIYWKFSESGDPYLMLF